MAKEKEIFNDLNLMVRLNQHIEELTSDDDSAAMLTKETSFKVLAELSSIHNPDEREDAQFDHQRRDFANFDASHLPFHLQGDQAFNEASALARRRQLRHCESIKAKIAFLWQVARGQKTPPTTTSNATARAQPPTTSSTRATIDEYEYSAMMLLIFKALRDDFVIDIARKQIQCDWEVDSHHGNELTYEQFYPALFELVDVWTCDLLEATYVRFLELLTRRITVRVVVFLDDMKLKLALSDNFDEAVVVKAIPLSTIKKFASVAKVMEGTGVRTVGELARADPQVVESQRVGYLERNTFSREKIGADLQHLLNMFREISQQFQHANYSFQDMVLKRVPASQSKGTCDNVDERAAQNIHDVDAASQSCSSTSAEGSVRVDDHLQNQSMGWSGTSTRGAATSSVSSGMNPHNSLSGSVSLSPGGRGHVGAVQSTSRVTPGWHPSEYVGDKGAVASSLGQEKDGPVGSAARGDSVLRRSGIKRINTFHDLSTTETGVIDALKATYLIEKGISLQRKTAPEDIRAELAKFGVDTTSMDDNDAAQKYGSLYEMFVLRDGDNVRSLAQSILARIKMELAAHGIIVNDDEVEAMYDGFYGSIVTGSGDGIVAEAKSWVDETVGNRGYESYIKHEYHELKSIDEVKLLGTEAGDEEFLSLLSTDAENESAEHSPDLPIMPDTLNVKSSGNLSRRPSLYRTADSPKRDHDQLLTQIQNETPLQGSAEQALGDSTVVNGKVNCAVKQSETHHQQVPNEDSIAIYSASRAGGIYLEESTTGESLGQPPTRPESSDTTTEIPDGYHRSAFTLDRIPQTTETINIEIQGSDPGLGFSPDASFESSSTFNIDNEAVPNRDGSQNSVTDTMDNEVLDARRTSIQVAFSVSSKPDQVAEIDPETSLGFYSNHNELDRAPQGIGYEYDNPKELVEVETADPTPTVVVREPKVPDIIVSGVDGGRHVLVAARYIQLLGLGKVHTIQPEDALLSCLSSPARTNFDLLCFDIGVDLDNAIAKTKLLVGLMGRGVIVFGGNEHEPEKTAVVARLCVTEGGAIWFASVPIDFPALRSQILAYFEGSEQPYILRNRRPTTLLGMAARAVPTTTRATNMLSVEEEFPRTVLTPPLNVENSGAKRKVTAISSPANVPLPQLAAPTRKPVSPFRPLRSLDEMPGADILTPSIKFNPVVPSSNIVRPNKKSPRMSAALKRLLH